MQERDIQMIARSLRCPIAWDGVCSSEEFSSQLRFMWFAAVWENQVDWQSTFISYDDWNPDEGTIANLFDEADVHAWWKNLRSWRARARRRYFSEMRRFASLKIATRDDYRKHYADERDSDEIVANRSAGSGDGVWYPRFSVAWQKKLAFAVLNAEWNAADAAFADGHLRDSPGDHTAPAQRAKAFRDRLVAPGNLSVLFDAGTPIGCALGKPTSYGHFKFSFSEPFIAHAYPCRMQDYKARYDVRWVPYWDVPHC